eukprot:Platyproteum_vivax@DN4066_c0_g1_i1.p1
MTCFLFQNDRLYFAQQKEMDSNHSRLLQVEMKPMSVSFGDAPEISDKEEDPKKPKKKFVRLSKDEEMKADRERLKKIEKLQKQLDDNRVTFKTCTLNKANQEAGVSKFECEGYPKKATLTLLITQPTTTKMKTFLHHETKVKVDPNYILLEFVVHWLGTEVDSAKHQVDVHVDWIFGEVTYWDLMDMNVNRVSSRNSGTQESEQENIDRKNPYKDKWVANGVIDFRFEVHELGVLCSGDCDTTKSKWSSQVANAIHHAGDAEITTATRFWSETPLNEVILRSIQKVESRISIGGMDEEMRFQGRLKLSPGEIRNGEYNAWSRFMTVFGLLLGYVIFWGLLVVAFIILYFVRRTRRRSEYHSE